MSTTETVHATDAGTIHIGNLEVPRFGYGTMRLTGPGIWGPPQDHDEAIRVLQRAVELGVRAIDTAWYYGEDVANGLVAEALRPYPEDLVLICKLGGARSDTGKWISGARPEQLRAGNERDLRILGLECIPVVHLRWPDRSQVPFAEMLGTLLDMQREGRIARLGLSNVTLELLDEALVATEIVTVSNAYGVHERSSEAVLRRCEERGIAFLPYFPLNAGNHEQQAELTRVAAEVGAPAAQVALAWTLRHSPAMLPIPGTSRVDHLEENLGAIALELPASATAALDAAV